MCNKFKKVREKLKKGVDKNEIFGGEAFDVNIFLGGSANETLRKESKADPV